MNTSLVFERLGLLAVGGFFVLLCLLTATSAHALDVHLSVGHHDPHRFHRSIHHRLHRFHHPSHHSLHRFGHGFHRGHSGVHGIGHGFDDDHHDFHEDYLIVGGLANLLRHSIHSSRAGSHSGHHDPATELHKEHGSNFEGWSYLSRGDVEHAAESFAHRAENHPRGGLPKVGYSLSYALSGHHDRAVWAMRRALRYEPDALNYVPLDDGHKHRLHELRKHYHDQAKHRETPVNALLMLTSVNVVLGDHERAVSALQRARSYDRYSKAFEALSRLADSGSEY